MNFKKSLFVLITLLLTSSAVLASSEEAQPLSSAGGISAPGGPTAVFQNPAGLVLNSGVGVTAQAGASDGFKEPIVRGGVLAGGTGYGLAAGVDHSTTKPTSTGAFYGLGVSVSSVSLGVAGQTGISPSTDTKLNAGVLIDLITARLGFTAVDVNNGVHEWGFGVSSTGTGPLAFIADAAYNNKTDGFGLKPGLRLGSTEAALTISYGLMDSKKTTQLTDGFTAGASLSFHSRSSLQVYYNDLDKFYAALTIAL